MFKNIIFVISSVLVAVQFAHGGGLSDEAQTRRQTCGSLVKPHSGSHGSNSGSGSGSGETLSTDTSASNTVVQTTAEISSNGYNCTLTDYFYELSVNLTSSQYTLWIQWINEIRITILSDYQLSDDEKVAAIGFSLKSFFEINVDIEATFSYLTLGSWGKVIDFVYVAYQIQMEASVGIVTLDTNSDCALFDALRNATANNTEQADAVEQLIAQFTIIFKQSSWSYAQQQAQIYLLLQSFFSLHADWQMYFFNIKIKNFGSFMSFFKSAKWYSKITLIGTVVQGDVLNCTLLLALEAAYQSTNYTISVRSQIKQLHDKLVAYFTSTTDVALRLSYFSSQCYQFYELISYFDVYIEQISMGSWGSIYDLLFCSAVCTNSGCGNIDNGPGTFAPVSTTVASTTIQSTTPLLTTPIPASCSNRASTIIINSSNQTVFTNAVNSARATWSASDKASFNTYWNKIVAAIWSTTLTQSQIITQIVTNCQSWNANNLPKQQLLFTVTLTQWYGTVGQFVACG